MKLLDKQLLVNRINTSEDFRRMAERMKTEVTDFCENFNDSPDKVSIWGHHYFCKDDGNVLTYNPHEPHRHICPLCRKSYSSELLDGVWVSIYRNEAALAILKSAILYRLTDEKRFLDYVVNLTNFYVSRFEEFVLHNKEGLVFDSLENMKWGCGRIMPQNLNEAIFFVRIFTSLELVKEKLPENLSKLITEKFADQFFRLLKPQVDKIHNISCWMDVAIGVVGLFCNNRELVGFTFSGEYNINRQLVEGVTEDGFWYEGSIHYNCFIMEGLVYLALFAGVYDEEFGAKNILEKMLIAVYDYAFSNQELPNPNDGWPNINLKTYSYIYAAGAKIYGYESPVGKILGQIISADYERGEIPLSKPYYFENKISLEQFVLIPDFEAKADLKPNLKSMDFEKSNYALLKNRNINVFYKYGHHGPSHAHPDKMNIEVVMGEKTLSRDLSNSGYGSVICNEWHRNTASHNTIVVDGKNHTSVEPGEKLSFTEDSCNASAQRVYEDVDFRRKIQIFENGFDDEFEVNSQTERNYDFIFHTEAELVTDPHNGFKISRDASLGFGDNGNNGYQYFDQLIRLVPKDGAGSLELTWALGNLKLLSKFDIKDTEVFLARTPSNPVTRYRTSIILRRKARHTVFHMQWNVREGGFI